MFIIDEFANFDSQSNQLDYAEAEWWSLAVATEMLWSVQDKARRDRILIADFETELYSVTDYIDDLLDNHECNWVGDDDVDDLRSEYLGSATQNWMLASPGYTPNHWDDCPF